jgi:hypothetical protein
MLKLKLKYSENLLNYPPQTNPSPCQTPALEPHRRLLKVTCGYCPSSCHTHLPCAWSPEPPLPPPAGGGGNYPSRPLPKPPDLPGRAPLKTPRGALPRQINYPVRPSFTLLLRHPDHNGRAQTLPHSPFPLYHVNQSCAPSSSSQSPARPCSRE